MKTLWLTSILGHLLMDANNGGDGGGGTGSLLTAPEGGGKPPEGAGNSDPTPGAGAPPPAGNPGTGDGTPGAAATDWRSALPKELQEDATFKKFDSVSTLAKSYLTAQKLIGADKIPVPTQNSTDEDWTNVHRKLGLPEKLEDYKVKFKEGVSLDEKFTKDFMSTAHKAGVLPKQAQALADWFSQTNVDSEKTVQGERTKAFNDGKAALQKEWGNSFDLNIARASKVITDLGGEETLKHINQLGLGGDPVVLKLLAKAGEAIYKEHKFVEGQGSSTSMSPTELDAEIRKVQADPAYTNKNHPNHKQAVDQARELFEKRFNQKDA